MRLLHTTKLTFDEYFNASIPSYCILSHRWGQDELTFSDVLDKRWRAKSEGYRKLYGVCKLASRLGFDWIWIDTCCIDKANNTELTEAINSMFKYYLNSKLCIAYLSDVGIAFKRDGRSPISIGNEDLCNSVWFTRG